MLKKCFVKPLSPDQIATLYHGNFLSVFSKGVNLLGRYITGDVQGLCLLRNTPGAPWVSRNTGHPDVSDSCVFGNTTVLGGVDANGFVDAAALDFSVKIIRQQFVDIVSLVIGVFNI